jgi:hypothetical protein
VLVVLKTTYANSPTKSYFFGGSKGGGEALQVAGRWPADWDGVVALYPARNYVVAMLAIIAITQDLAAPKAYLNLAKRGALYRPHRTFVAKNVVLMLRSSKPA